MIDLVNGIIIAICAFGLGVALHSLWNHAVEKGELKDWWRVIRNKKKKQ